MRGWIMAVLASVICAWCWLLPTGSQPPPSAAAALEKVSPALKMLPENAALFQSYLRLGEQWQRLQSSQAWKKFTQLSFVQDAWTQIKAVPLGPDGMPLQNWFEQPAFQEQWKMICPLLQQEVFLYAGEDVSHLFSLLGHLNAAITAARFEHAFVVDRGNLALDQVRQMLYTLNEHWDDLVVPDVMIGFKVPDQRLAETMWIKLKLEWLIQLQALPIWKDRVRLQKLGGVEYLTLQWDGKMVPWELFPWKEFEDEEGEFEDLRDHLRALKGVVCIGLKEQYFIVSLSESTDFITDLSKGPRLLERKELAPLAGLADRAICGISYLCSDLRGTTTSQTMQEWLDEMDEILEDFNVDEKIAERIKADLEALIDKWLTYETEFGALVSCSMLAPNGYETREWDYSRYPLVDGSKPLSLLSHLGGQPCAAHVGRAKHHAEVYELAAKWVPIAHRHMETLLLPIWPDEFKDVYQDVMRWVKPLAARFDRANRLFIASMDDGQTGWVLDAQWQSQQWHRVLPKSPDALPMLEFGAILTVKNPAQCRQACEEYRLIFNETMAHLQTWWPNLPPFEIPSPEVKEQSGHTYFHFALPKSWGLDEQMAPTGGLSKQVGVLALSPKHAERLLRPTPLQWPKDTLSEWSDRPLVSVTYVRTGELIRKTLPWYDFLLQADGMGIKDSLGWSDQVCREARELIELLACWEGYYSVTHQDKNVQVTRSFWVFTDWAN